LRIVGGYEFYPSTPLHSNPRQVNFKKIQAKPSQTKAPACRFLKELDARSWLVVRPATASLLLQLFLAVISTKDCLASCSFLH
jgi:hypothetical protein